MSAFEFNVTLTRDPLNWGTLLVETLKKSFTHISQQIEDNSVKQEIEQLTLTVKESIESINGVKKTADEALQLAKSNSSEIVVLREELREMKSACDHLREENVQLKYRADDTEIYSRKDNLVIKGITEIENENDEQCMNGVKLFFRNQLNIDSTVVDNMNFVRCHRLGSVRNARDNENKSRDRPIIVRFQRYSDRILIWNGRFVLKNNHQFNISENFPGNIGYNRRKLQPIYKRAKQIGEYNRNISLRGDRLYVNGNTYTIDNIEKLPENIHPKHLCTMENEGALVSGGLLSEYSFLSNYSPCDLEYDSVKYETLEQGYGHIRAKYFKDHESAAKILATKNPAEVKRLGYKVRGFKAAEWSKVKEDVMLKLLRIKFRAGTKMAENLKNTGRKLLAESGRDAFYSCGMSLTHPDVLDTTKWKSNVLGKLQMKIRNELNEL